MKKLLIACLMATTGIASAEAYLDANAGVNTTWGSPAFNINAGYMFNQYFGVEGGLTYSGGDTETLGTISSTSSYYMLDMAAKGVLPLSSRFALYGKLGGAGGYNINNFVGALSPVMPTGLSGGLFLGAGAQFNLSNNWSLHLEDIQTINFESIQLFSGHSNPNILLLGGQFNF